MKNILILLLIIINIYFIFDEVSLYFKILYKDKFSNINNYNIDCYIIHLDRSKDRISNIKKQQTKTNLNIKYFSAVDSKKLNKVKLIKEKILDPKYAKISRVEHYGCFLSHVNVIKKIANNYKNKSKAKYTLVLEDDFNIIDNDFDNKLLKIIKDIEKIKYNFDIIFIGNKGDNKIYDKNIINNIYTIPEGNYNVTAESYIVNNKNASKIAKLLNYINVPIDFKFRDLRNNKSINCLIIKPLLVNQNLNYESTIK